jgi:hypothetical protein
MLAVGSYYRVTKAWGRLDGGGTSIERGDGGRGTEAVDFDTIY